MLIPVLPVVNIARIAHEANRRYCEAIGDHSQMQWDDAAEWQRSSAIAGVESYIAADGLSPEEQHDAWMSEKRADGWTYGAVKDHQIKTHPCIVPYAELPQEQRVKDIIFGSIVGSLCIENNG